ncbi:hypothetical protein [Streptomyces sp. SD15]
MRQAIAEAIAFFDYNGEGEELQPEWDSWSLGAAGSEFWIKAGCEADPRLVREYEPTREGSTHSVPPDRCTGGPVGLLDIEGQRSRAVAEAGALWCEWEEFSAGFPPARSLDDLIAEEPEASDRRPGLAWHRYSVQPLMRAVLADPGLHRRFGERAVGDFGVGHERFLRRKADESLVRDGLVTLEGQWISWGSLPHDEYVGVFNGYIGELSPDVVLVNITCHG